MSVILQTTKLAIGYKKTAIQSNLNLEVQTGELICLIGPNGCGKSTLLRSMAGLQKSLNGTITLNNKDLQELSNTEKALVLSLVLTDKIEVENLTVFELVFTGRYPHTSWLGNSNSIDQEKTLEAIEMVQLSHKKDSPINELSDGEKQRAMIAKALAQDTALIFLDEPTAHLDLPNRVDIILLLRKLAKKTNKAIVLSTHELDLAIQASDQLWLMNENGIECGKPKSLVAKGLIQKTFANNAVEFNAELGNFRLKL